MFSLSSSNLGDWSFVSIIIVFNGVLIGLHASIPIKFFYYFFIWFDWDEKSTCNMNSKKYSISPISITLNYDFNFFLVWGSNLCGSLDTIIQSISTYRAIIANEFLIYFNVNICIGSMLLTSNFNQICIY